MPAAAPGEFSTIEVTSTPVGSPSNASSDARASATTTPGESAGRQLGALRFVRGLLHQLERLLHPASGGALAGKSAHDAHNASRVRDGRVFKGSIAWRQYGGEEKRRNDPERGTAMSDDSACASGPVPSLAEQRRAVLEARVADACERSE